MDCTRVLIGRRFALYALRKDDGECLVSDFVANLERPDQKRLVALLDYTKDNGPPKNREKCDRVTDLDGLFEFKSYQDRVPWFYDGKDADGRGRIVMTHGFKKKSNRAPTRELRRAEEMRHQYLEARRRRLR
ncbi:MAG: type II toxin-antitoxin system RelE/ParE family toxin [Dehalococcoidia bacterium]|nr:type II toxin-antitoxin system RelE/ParE family toxin [Dehalococcoidia bacterium]